MHNQTLQILKIMLLEIKDMLSGMIAIPFPTSEKECVYEIEMANNANELERL